MNYKLLALDLDDTLLSEDLTISQGNIDAIRAMDKQGVKIVLCSGRPYESMVKYLEVLDIHDEGDFIVSSNGAMIHKISGELISSTTVKGDALKALIGFGKKYDIDVQLYTPELTVGRITERTEHYEQLTGMVPKLSENLTVYEESIKVLFNHVAGEELENLRLELVEAFGDDYNIFYSKPNYIEFLDKKSSKGLAVAQIAKGYNIDPKDVVAMGDGFNDVSMIEYAGVGVAVANAPEGVKAKANYVTEADHNHNAIEEVYHKFFERH